MDLLELFKNAVLNDAEIRTSIAAAAGCLAMIVVRYISVITTKLVGRGLKASWVWVSTPTPPPPAPPAPEISETVQKMLLAIPETVVHKIGDGEYNLSDGDFKVTVREDLCFRYFLESSPLESVIQKHEMPLLKEAVKTRLEVYEAKVKMVLANRVNAALTRDWNVPLEDDAKGVRNGETKTPTR